MKYARQSVFLLTLASLAGAGLPAVAGDLAPGAHKRIPCKDKPKWTYDVYIPGAYTASSGQRRSPDRAREPEKKLPVLFLSSPGTNPGFMGHEAWAGSRGVILVTVNDSANSVIENAARRADGWAKIAEMQDAVIESAEETLRMHPCLRFSMGCSGAGWASMLMAGRYGDRHAGVVMLAHSGNGADGKLAKHIAVAFIHGEQDDVHPVSASRGVCKRLKSRGNPTRIKTGPWGHNDSTRENREEMLDWMLELMRLTHPKLPPGELKAARDEIKRRAGALADLDATERLAEAGRLMSLPKRLWQRYSRELHKGWFSASHERASAITDPVAQHNALSDMSEDERARMCSPSDRKKLMGELRKLRREPAVKKEWKARQIYAQIAAMEKKLPDRPPKSRKMKVVNSYVMLARKYPNTIYGMQAAEDVKRMMGN